MKDTTGILVVLDRRIQALQQSRPGFTPGLQDLPGARAAFAELMAVVEAFPELRLQPDEREERAICAWNGARGFSSGDHGSNSYQGAASRTRRISSVPSKESSS